VPIGGVVAYRNAISPTGVGYDIGCGNKAVRLDMTGADLRLNIGRIMDEIFRIPSGNNGRTSEVR
jgi:tRNA-splicing ligase RtcB